MPLVRPKAVIFDVIETIISLEPLRRELVTLGLDHGSLETFFAFGLRDAFALNATDRSPSFVEVLRGALDQLLAIRGISAPTEAKDAVFSTLARLPAHADAEAALRRLRKAGIPIYALSNGAKTSTERYLAANGLDGFIRDVLSVETVGAFKPRRIVYEHAVQATGETAENVMLVATHAWDTHGARNAGIMSAFVVRGQIYPKTMMQPDLTAETLLGVADAILALPSSR